MVDPFVLVSTGLAVFITLGILSIAFKETYFYRIVEFIIVGSGASYMFVLNFNNAISIVITPFAKGAMLLGLPFLLGIMLLARVSPKYAWVGRYPIAVMIGVGAGLTIRTVMYAQFLGVIKDTLVPLNTQDMFLNVSNLLLVIMSLCALLFFIFTREQKGKWAWPTRFGRMVLMISFGVGFGGIFLARASAFIGRVYFIVVDFLIHMVLGM
jgi:hypothetical protein